MTDDLKRLLSNPIFLIFLPAIVYATAFLLEAGYFERAGADITLMQVDYQVIIESIPFGLFFMIMLYVVYSITEAVINFKPPYWNYKKRKNKILYPLAVSSVKSLVISVIYVLLIWGVSEQFKFSFFSMLKSYALIAYIVAFLSCLIISTDLIKAVSTRKFPKDILRNTARSINYSLMLITVVLSVFFFGQIKYDQTKKMWTVIDNQKYDVIRVYQNEILVGKIFQKNYGYWGYLIIRNNDIPIYER